MRMQTLGHFVSVERARTASVRSFRFVLDQVEAREES